MSKTAPYVDTRMEIVPHTIRVVMVHHFTTTLPVAPLVVRMVCAIAVAGRLAVVGLGVPQVVIPQKIMGHIHLVDVPRIAKWQSPAMFQKRDGWLLPLWSQ